MKTIKLTVQDLMHIHSIARDACIQLPSDSKYHKDNQHLQSYSFTCGVVGLLNSKGLLDLEVKIDKGKSEYD